MPTRLSGSPDLSVSKKSTSSVFETSSSQSLLRPAITTASSGVSLTPGTEVRRRSLKQPPGPAWPPVPRDSSVSVTSSQTNGQGFVQRKYLFILKKEITSEMNVIMILATSVFHECMTVFILLHKHMHGPETLSPCDEMVTALLIYYIIFSIYCFFNFLLNPIIPKYNFFCSVF